MSKEEVIQILVDRDGIDREEARMLINETIDEIIQNPMEADEIIIDYLGLEPDYLEYLI